jgi:hypothetical protein
LKYRLSFFSAVLLWLFLAAPAPGAEGDPRFKAGEEMLDAWRIAEA